MKVCLACGERFVSTGWLCPTCGHSPSLGAGYPLFAPDVASGDGSDVEYRYEDLYRVEANNFWFRSRNRLLIWALRRYFPDAQSFFEIGCGTGFVAAEIARVFPGMLLSASDVLVKGLVFAQRRLPQAQLYQMDARRMPFESEFDVIGAFDVLEHIVEDQVVLTQMFEVTVASTPG